jgi:hypothetical protein
MMTRLDSVALAEEALLTLTEMGDDLSLMDVDFLSLPETAGRLPSTNRIGSGLQVVSNREIHSS